MKFSFESEIWEEEGQYVARANPFNVMTCARTKQEAQEALLEAVELFFETAQNIWVPWRTSWSNVAIRPRKIHGSS